MLMMMGWAPTRWASGWTVAVAYAWRTRGVCGSVASGQKWRRADEDLAKAGEYGWVNGELGWVERTGRELHMDDDWTCCTSGGQANDVGMGKRNDKLLCCEFLIKNLGVINFHWFCLRPAKSLKPKSLPKLLTLKSECHKYLGMAED